GLPWDTALRKVSALMKRKFSRHKHEKDIRIGVSPRSIKYTQYRAGINQPLRSYQFGVCRATISEGEEA
ncbi:MAG: hypothetical protein Q4F74_01740, partial [Synergistaceae bacterium]|nr:hypothetical protein [Synergistaceae bacterium]